jgi:Tfp pilus assembly protein PilX
VTAAGYGGSQSAASVVQSTYAITPSSTALDAP